MGDVLNDQQENAVGVAIKELAKLHKLVRTKLSTRVQDKLHIHGKNQEAQEITESLIWDLTLLVHPDVRKGDERSVEEVQEDLNKTGRSRLERLDKLTVGHDYDVLFMEEIDALLTVVGVLPPQQEKANTHWQDRARAGKQNSGAPTR